MQLVEVILDAYSARQEIKEYFEYYLNPDVDKLTEKYMRVITRELGRVKRHTCAARVSVINKTVKLYRSFFPGIDNEVRFLTSVIGIMGETEWRVYLTDVQWKLVHKLVMDVMSTADRGEIADMALVYFDSILSGEKIKCSVVFKREVKAAIVEYDTEKATIGKKAVEANRAGAMQ